MPARKCQNCLKCSPCPHGKIKNNCVQCSRMPTWQDQAQLRAVQRMPTWKDQAEFCLQCSACPHGKLKRSCRMCRSKAKRELHATKLDVQLFGIFGYCKVGWVEVI
ncbi:unnamed protein product [Effrenium voratum]|nr:unnamed protein product [Effrenium voratum]